LGAIVGATAASFFSTMNGGSSQLRSVRRHEMTLYNVRICKVQEKIVIPVLKKEIPEKPERVGKESERGSCVEESVKSVL
jgi:hypothetical protein